MSRPPHSPWFHQPNNIWGWVQTIKVFTVQFPPFCCNFTSLFGPNILLKTLFSNFLNIILKWECVGDELLLKGNINITADTELTTWSTVLTEKLICHWSSQQIYRLLWNSRTHYHVHMSSTTDTYPERDQSRPQPPNPSFITTHFKIDLSAATALPRGFFLSDSQRIFLCISFLARALREPIITFSDHPNNTWRTATYVSLFIMKLLILQFPVTSSVLDPNILLSILFSGKFILRFSLNVRDQILHSYKITGRFIF
jgi:hypothetical protein